jgi:UTP--glucose-1-phosphate uridylyltransferase
MIGVFEKYQAPVIGTMQVEGRAISGSALSTRKKVEPGVFRSGHGQKPSFADAPSDLAIIGRYIFTPDIFEESRIQARSRQPDPNHRYVTAF